MSKVVRGLSGSVYDGFKPPEPPRPERSATVGMVSLGCAVVAVALLAFALSAAARTPGSFVDGRLDEAAFVAAVEARRGVVLAGLGAVVAGIGLGVLAIVRRLGRHWGVAGVLAAVLAPVVAVGLGVVTGMGLLG